LQKENTWYLQDAKDEIHFLFKTSYLEVWIWIKIIDIEAGRTFTVNWIKP